MIVAAPTGRLVASMQDADGNVTGLIQPQGILTDMPSVTSGEA